MAVPFNPWGRIPPKKLTIRTFASSATAIRAAPSTKASATRATICPPASPPVNATARATSKGVAATSASKDSGTLPNPIRKDASPADAICSVPTRTRSLQFHPFQKPSNLKRCHIAPRRHVEANSKCNEVESLILAGLQRLQRRVRVQALRDRTRLRPVSSGTLGSLRYP